jgi:hypothetical protein
MSAIYTVVGELRAAGVDVLSPSDPRIVDHIGEFLFVASDKLRSIKLVQERHLQCLRMSSFLWLVTPDGYVGPSASMEIGFAVAVGTPVLSDNLPFDITLREYVTKVPNISSAISRARVPDRSRQASSVLIDPRTSIESAHDVLDDLGPLLRGDRSTASKEAQSHYQSSRLFFKNTFDIR